MDGDMVMDRVHGRNLSMEARLEEDRRFFADRGATVETDGAGIDDLLAGHQNSLDAYLFRLPVNLRTGSSSSSIETDRDQRVLNVFELRVEPDQPSYVVAHFLVPAMAGFEGDVRFQPTVAEEDGSLVVTYRTDLLALSEADAQRRRILEDMLSDHRGRIRHAVGILEACEDVIDARNEAVAAPVVDLVGRMRSAKAADDLFRAMLHEHASGS